MSRSIKSIKSISHNKSIQLGNKSIIIFLLLFFVFPATPSLIFADVFDKEGRDFIEEESRGKYYRDHSLQGDARGEKGNGATGVLAAFLLLLANLNVLLSIIVKGLNRLFSFSPETKNSISSFNRVQKKYLSGLHYILNPIAICIAIVHFYLSSCRSILPDVALILFLVIGILGLLLKFKLLPKAIYNVSYGLHCSSITFAALIFLMAIGHA
jgi:hypothetical protein